jgi:hypothetical protein
LTTGETTARAVDVLADMLARRDHTEVEARQRLSGSFDEAAVEDALVRGRRSGWLDDARLAERVIERLLAKKPPLARARIASDLAARGLSGDLAAVDDHARVMAYLAVEKRRAPAARLFGRLVRAGHEPERLSEAFEVSGLTAGAPEDVVREDLDEHAFDAEARDESEALSTKRSRRR